VTHHHLSSFPLPQTKTSILLLSGQTGHCDSSQSPSPTCQTWSGLSFESRDVLYLSSLLAHFFLWVSCVLYVLVSVRLVFTPVWRVYVTLYPTLSWRVNRQIPLDLSLVAPGSYSQKGPVTLAGILCPEPLMEQGSRGLFLQVKEAL
jgi:hypothetical protein